VNRPTDVEGLVKQLLAGATREEGRTLLDGLLNGHVSSIFEKLDTEQAPTLASDAGRCSRVPGSSGPTWRETAGLATA
jgi:hypothetical protein